MIIKYFIILFSFCFLFVLQGFAQNTSLDSRKMNTSKGFTEITFMKKTHPSSVHPTATSVFGTEPVKGSEDIVNEIIQTKRLHSSGVQPIVVRDNIVSLKLNNKTKINEITLSKKSQPSGQNMEAIENE